MNRSLSLLCLCVILVELLTASGVADEKPSAQPNILFILADDVGQEVLECYGGESYPTPHLNELARTGMKFTHAFSMPVCHPTRICFLTGRYPRTLDNPAWGAFPRALETQTVAHTMKRLGYATAVAGKWQLTLLGKDLQQPHRLEIPLQPKDRVAVDLVHQYLARRTRSDRKQLVIDWLARGFQLVEIGVFAR